METAQRENAEIEQKKLDKIVEKINESAEQKRLDEWFWMMKNFNISSFQA